MTQDTTLANAEIVLPDRVGRGRLHLAGGLVAAVEDSGAVPRGAEPSKLHTDTLERHLKPRPCVDWPRASVIIAHDADLAGVGITTAFDALRVGSIVSGQDRGEAP